MDFPNGTTVFRDRRALVTDPNHPSRQTRDGDWDVSLTIVLAGAFVASSSSSSTKNANRIEVLTAKSLYGTDPTADVVFGDRIRVGGTQSDLTSGTAYLVDAVPDADTNPFTGWQPAVEIPLRRDEG